MRVPESTDQLNLHPIVEGKRAVVAAPGARLAVVSVDDVADLVAGIEARLERHGLTGLFAPLADLDGGLAEEPDDDPDLGSVLARCRPRLLMTFTAGLALLPPSRRFNVELHDSLCRVFAASRWINGVNGYVLAPSSLRPGMSVWGYSEGGTVERGEIGPVTNWVTELLGPLDDLLRRLDEEDGPGVRAEKRDQITANARKHWEFIERDLRPPQPRPDWTRPGGPTAAPSGEGWHGEVVGGRSHGVWTRYYRGAVTREETYVNGVRHGPVTWWHLFWDIDEDRSDGDLDPVVWERGHLAREGQFADGAAHGPFRFFDEHGQLQQEGSYEHGWPQGTWTVYPAATRGLAEPATVEHEAGVPVRWSIPPLAFDSVALRRAAGEPTTLAALAAGHRGVVLVDCTDASDHELAQRDVDALAELTDVLVVGIHPDRPGAGRLGQRAIEVLTDPSGHLLPSYHGQAMPLTFLNPDGTARPRAGANLKSARIASAFSE
jgi:hypothetical protein